jgi:hypothetical protein
MPDEVDESTEDAGAVPVAAAGPKRPPRQFIRSARRKITEEEASSPVVVKFLLEDIDRLEADKSDLVAYRESYHRVDKQAAILRSEIVNWQSGDILYTVCIAVGSACLGGASGYTGISFYFLIAVSIILLVGALSFRFWRLGGPFIVNFLRRPGG